MAEITVTLDNGEVVEVFSVPANYKLSGVSLGVLWMNVLEALERARRIAHYDQIGAEADERKSTDG